MLDDGALLRVDGRQAGEGVVERDQIHDLLFKQTKVFVKRYLVPATSLGGMMSSRVINEDSPHQIGRDAEKMGPALPADVCLAHQPEVRLVNESRGLKRMIRPLAAPLLQSKSNWVMSFGEGAIPSSLPLF